MVAKRCICHLLAAKIGCTGQWRGVYLIVKERPVTAEGEKSEPLYNKGKCCAILGPKAWIYWEMRARKIIHGLFGVIWITDIWA